MAEEHIFFDAGGVRIEGFFESPPGDMGVVVTHPHPLYGGDMYNTVVEAVVLAYRTKGYSTLRFNFRGVGRSEGNHEEGLGEQEDVKGALAHLQEREKRHIDLVGYSFGAWVNARGIDRFDRAERLIMVSPPVNLIPFDFLSFNPKIKLVIVGDRDDIAGSDPIKDTISQWNPEAMLHVIKGADHFYFGYTEQLKDIIINFLE